MTRTRPDDMNDEDDLYAVLGLPPHPEGKKCTAAEIKKAYYRLALRHHPDKQPNSASMEQLEDANRSFQLVGRAYDVLGDEEKRKRYDLTGRVDESALNADDLDAYFRGISP